MPDLALSSIPPARQPAAFPVRLEMFHLCWSLEVAKDRSLQCPSHAIWALQNNDRGEPAVSYRWTGWVWENNQLKFIKTAGKLWIILEEFIEYIPILQRETGGCEHVTDWTCKYHDLNRLWCPKISPISASKDVYTALKTTLQHATPNWEMKTSLDVLSIICPSQEPTSVGQCHYKKWSSMVDSWFFALYWKHVQYSSFLILLDWRLGFELAL